MDKIIKLQSIQGSGFDANKKLCDFDIPSGAVYDLSSSYINLVANITTDDGGANGGQGIYEITTSFDGFINYSNNGDSSRAEQFSAKRADGTEQHYGIKFYPSGGTFAEIKISVLGYNKT